MTSEEIKAAIDRLKAIPCDGMPVVYRVASAFMDMNINVAYSDLGLRNRLIALLRQADPDTHMEMPVDADGVPIHVGDEMCGYDHPNGGVYCHAVVNPCVIAVGKMSDYGNSKGWELWNTLDVHHYRKPTVEDVLNELCTKAFHSREFGAHVSYKDVIAEYAAKLRLKEG